MNMYSKKVICLVLIISLMAALMPIDTHMSNVIAEGNNSSDESLTTSMRIPTATSVTTINMKNYGFQQIMMQAMAFADNKRNEFVGLLEDLNKQNIDSKVKIIKSDYFTYMTEPDIYDALGVYMELPFSPRLAIIVTIRHGYEKDLTDEFIIHALPANIIEKVNKDFSGNSENNNGVRFIMTMLINMKGYTYESIATDQHIDIRLVKFNRFERYKSVKSLVSIVLSIIETLPCPDTSFDGFIDYYEEYINSLSYDDIKAYKTFLNGPAGNLGLYISIPTPTNTPIPTETPTPTPTVTSTAIATNTSLPTAMPTSTPTHEATEATVTPTATTDVTPTPINTMTPTHTATPKSNSLVYQNQAYVPEATPRFTPTHTPTYTPTYTPTITPTPIATVRPTTKEQVTEIPGGSLFKDLLNHWANEYIAKLYSKGIINGYPDGTIKPDNDISRAEVAVILAKALGVNPKATNASKFKDISDVPESMLQYINVLAEKGIFKGYEDGSFKPDNKITRAEFITVIMRAYNIKPSDNKTKFIDSNKIPSWAEGYIAVSIEKNIIKGYPDGSFRPQQNIKRGEAFYILFGCLNLSNTD